MSEANAFDFGKFIPGFDFLQKLASTSASGAASPMPGLGGWVAPTVSVDELDKRIGELKSVLFWLEQNAATLKATIQMLEVQKLTLATLEGMNLSMAEVAKAFTLPTADADAAAPAPAPAAAGQWPYAKPPAPVAEPARAAAPEPAPETKPEPKAEPARKSAARAKAAPQPARPPAAPAAAAAGVVDPLQWWGALTQQFQQIAAEALRESARTAPTGAADAASADPAAAPAQQDAAPAAAAGKAARGATKKAAARKRAAKKAAARKPAAKKPAAAKPEPAGAAKPAAPGWPLPPPFKFGR